MATTTEIPITIKVYLKISRRLNQLTFLSSRKTSLKKLGILLKKLANLIILIIQILKLNVNLGSIYLGF